MDIAYGDGRARGSFVVTELSDFARYAPPIFQFFCVTQQEVVTPQFIIFLA